MLQFANSNLLAQRGLREVQALCGAPEMTLFGHGREVLQEPQFRIFHICRIYCATKHVLDSEDARS